MLDPSRLEYTLNTNWHQLEGEGDMFQGFNEKDEKEVRGGG